MTKPNGPRCNIDCKYCYYLDKEKLYPETKKFRMSDAVLDTYIRDYMAAQVETGSPEVVFAWQGGEPTILGVDYFREIVALQKKHRPDGLTVRNSIQTNGMLLNDEWGQFLKEHDFLVGISIDGPRKLHDRYRVDRAGRPTFDTVMRGLDLLQAHQVEHNALTVVHRDNALKPREIYSFLRGKGIEFLQFIPIVERSSDGEQLSGVPQLDDDGDDPSVTSWSVRPRAYGKFLCDIFDIWVKRDVGQIFVQHFDVQLGLWMGRPSALCWFSEECGQGLAMEHNGDLYACDHYVYPEYRLGNIMETPLTEMAWSQEQQAFGRDKAAGLPGQCRACEFRFACNGGCPKHRFARTSDGEDGLNYLCEAYLRFSRHAGPKLTEMAQLLRAGRPAADIMRR
ncbi:MAG: anaerobic sulfatase maturase [Alphaproteobacteria bacterium]